MPNAAPQLGSRLTADEGMALTNDGGVTVWNCIAVDSADGWTEIDAPAPEDEDATEADYKTTFTEPVQ